MKLTARETIVTEFEATQYGPNGPLNQPQRKHHTVETFSATARDAALKLRQRQTTDFAYDFNKFLRSVTTETKKFNVRANALRPTERDVVTYADAAHGQVEQANMKYSFNAKGEPVLRSRSTQFNAGYRVGGPRPPNSGVDVGVAGMEPIWAHVIVSSEDDARAVQYSNPHMQAADLDYMRAGLDAASGLVQYTLRFQGPAMPWLRKGAYIHLTDFLDADGIDIPLAPALITDVRLDFDASSERPSSLASVAAVFWRAD